MKKVLIVILILIGLYLILCIAGPGHFTMERSTDIKAPKDVVFSNIVKYERFNKWSPWAELDPNMTYSVEGNDGTVGAVYKWKGNKQVGSGNMTITDIKPNESMSEDLMFLEPFESKAKVVMKVADGANGDTKASWGFETEFPFFMRAMMLFMNMEKGLAADFDKGLGKLKAMSEKDALTAKAAQVPASPAPADTTNMAPAAK